MSSLLQIVTSGMLLGGVYTIIALGLNLLFGVMKVINFAHGELLMLAAYALFNLFTLFGVNPYLLILPVLFFSAVIGVIFYLVVVSHIVGRSEFEEASIIITFSLSIILTNLARILWSSDFKSVTYYFGVSKFFGISISNAFLYSFIVSVVVAVIFYIFLKKTYLGKAIRAVSQNVVASQLMGINPKLIYLVSCILSACLAGLGGALVAMIYPIYPEMGGHYTFLAFCIVVLGGLGNFIGTFLGAFSLALIESITAFAIGTPWRPLVSFIFIILAILLRHRIRRV